MLVVLLLVVFVAICRWGLARREDDSPGTARAVPVRPSVIDEVRRANERFAEHFALGDLDARPARRFAVVTCMDARLAVEAALGLKPGDAHVLRNAGGVVTEDVLRSLIISHHLLGTQEFLIIQHTGCGLLTFRDEDLRGRLERQTGRCVAVPAHFHTFRDLGESLRRQVAAVRLHPWVPAPVRVRGLLYDVQTGRLHEVALSE